MNSSAPLLTLSEPGHDYRIHALTGAATGSTRDLSGPLSAEINAAFAASPDGEIAVRSVDVNIPLLEKNDILAERNRGYFLGRGLTALNLVSSPGAGKTTLLERTLDEFGRQTRCAVLVGDLETDNDGRRLCRPHAPVAQITTGTVCHLDARMIARAAQSIDLDGVKILFIENVGNLVCPASFDLGEQVRVVLLSTTEGEDKPLKYPPIFKSANLVLLTKVDVADVLGFKRDVAVENIRRIAPQAQIIQLSARTGEGLAEWYAFLQARAGRRQTPLPMPTSPPVSDVLIRVRGTVQGVGYRPFVHRTATQLGLAGWVRNDAEGVLIRAAGDARHVAALAEALVHAAPDAAEVTDLDESQPGPADAPVGVRFSIALSGPGGEITTAIPPDLALCDDCRRELLDPANRRHRYPFINCTQCGPRYSIIERLPYDRPQTTMRAFCQCPDCQREYDDPASRRFHAEPNACPVCGPHLTLTNPRGETTAEREEALRTACDLLRGGAILAVKGVGGYHLMCDATHGPAVISLRQRKHRDEKPLAVMFRDLDQLRRFSTVSAAAAQLLRSPASPVVLVLQRGDVRRSTLAASVAPGNPWIGALLPSNPLHVLLLESLTFPVIATSANLSEEPICTDPAEARRRLAGIADMFLDHDRPIARAVDDSVVRLADHHVPILLRRARGYAPAPLALPGRLPAPILCVGGHMKNTIAVAAGTQVVLSPHLGDLEGAATRRLFEQTIATLGELHGARFATVVHDQHPGYSSTLYAEMSGLPRLAVQHHLAHVLACLLEHGQPAHDVLGIAWDGTGHGPDGTVWGGEFLLLENNRAERFARLRPFRLAGSEAAVRDTRRIALGLAHELNTFPAMAAQLQCSENETALLGTMLRHGLNSPFCSSAGRLFDAFAILLGLGRKNSFEGQLPLAVEAAATAACPSSQTLHFPVRPAATPGARFDIDWGPAVTKVLRPDRDAAADAAALHRGLVRAMVDVAREAGAGTVVLTGGCFQNALLHSLAAAALSAAGFRVLVHQRLSPNDNSIAAGQALAALWQLSSVTLPT